MKKTLFVLIMGISLQITLFANEYSGKGSAIVGNGITIEKAEEVAEILAKREALSSYGVYIETESILKNGELTKDEIMSISAGVVTLKDNSKKITKEFKNDNFYINYEGIFIINDKDFDFNMKNYQKKKEGSSELKNALSKISELEEKIRKIENNETNKKENNYSSVLELNKSYESFNSEMKIDGFVELKNMRNEKIQKLRAKIMFLNDFKNLGYPKKLIDISVANINVKEDKIDSKYVQVILNIKETKNEKGVAELKKLYEKYATYINENEVEEVLKKVVYEDKGFPIVISFLDENKNLLFVLDDFGEIYEQYKNKIYYDSNFALQFQYNNKEKGLGVFYYANYFRDDKKKSVSEYVPIELLSKTKYVDIGYYNFFLNSNSLAIFKKNTFGGNTNRYSYLTPLTGNIKQSEYEMIKETFETKIDLIVNDYKKEVKNIENEEKLNNINWDIN